MVAWAVGAREPATAHAVMAQLAARVGGRIQLTTDGQHHVPGRRAGGLRLTHRLCPADQGVRPGRTAPHPQVPPDRGPAPAPQKSYPPRLKSPEYLRRKSAPVCASRLSCGARSAAATEFKLLRILSVNGGRVVTTDALLSRVGGHRSRAHRREEAPRKAPRRRGRAHLYLHRARSRLPHGHPGRGVEGPRAGRHRLGERPSRAAAQPPCLPCRGYCSSFQSERVAQSQSPSASLLSARARSRSPSPRRTERSRRSTRRPRSASPAARATP